VFTGGSVIGGGAARTDLITPEDTEPLARAQFRSFRRLAALPDAAELRPTHGAGSFCSTGAKPSGVMTLGSERRTNALLALEDEDEFVRYLLAGYGSFPPYFLRLRDVNRSGAPLLRELPAVPVLEVDAAREAVQAGAWLVDARAAVQWSAAHPEGAVSISLDGSFATWLGWVIPFGEPIVFIIDAARLDDAVRQARRIGYDRLVGFLAPDPEAWRQAGWNVLSAPVYEPGEAAELSGDGWRLLDVRQDSEVAGGRIPGAMHIELGDIVGGSVPEGPVITYCGHGERSATAASLLERRGIEAASLRGGIGSWKDAKLPVQ
jgi:rhodanese-related sulfurtransferase